MTDEEYIQKKKTDKDYQNEINDFKKGKKYDNILNKELSKESAKWLDSYILECVEELWKQAQAEVLDKLKEYMNQAWEQEDYDIMVKDGKDGTITISLKEFFENKLEQLKKKQK